MSETMAPEARLGNDIARQFAHLPHDAAIAGIAGHIGRFWDPRMRANLHKLVAEESPDLDPLLVDAADTL